MGHLDEVALTGDVMRASNKKRVMVLVALVLIVAVVPPVLFGAPRQIEGQSGGDLWRNIIFDFQTLITGLLAVGAAAWTVMTMERTDKKADWRHRELVSLALRADRLRVERMLFPAKVELGDLYDDMIDVDLEEVQELAYSAPRTAALIFARMTRICEAVRGTLQRQVFNAGRDLFDGKLTYEYDEVVGCSTEFQRLSFDLQQRFAGLDKTMRDDREIFEIAYREAVPDLIELLNTFGYARTMLGRVLDSLEMMRKEFVIQHFTPSPSLL